MPGAYAHITIVNHLREPARLESLPDFPNEIIPSAKPGSESNCF